MASTTAIKRNVTFYVLYKNGTWGKRLVTLTGNAAQHDDTAAIFNAKHILDMEMNRDTVECIGPLYDLGDIEKET